MGNRQLTFLYLSTYGQLSAAADEQRALHILQGSARYVTVECQKVFPNLKVNLRDQTNATTRWPHNVNKHDVAHTVWDKTIAHNGAYMITCSAHCLTACAGCQQRLGWLTCLGVIP